MQINGKPLTLWRSAAQIQAGIDALAADLNARYQNAEQPVVLLGVLAGAFLFHADLAKRLTFPLLVDFLRTTSYVDNKPSGALTLDARLKYDPRGRRVIVTEDIVDSGRSMDGVVAELLALGAASVEVCAVVGHRATEYPEVNSRVNYVFEKESLYYVGYGMDFDELHRQYDAIYYL